MPRSTDRDVAAEWRVEPDLSAKDAFMRWSMREYASGPAFRTARLTVAETDLLAGYAKEGTVYTDSHGKPWRQFVWPFGRLFVEVTGAD